MDLRPHIEKFRRRFAEVETALSDPKVFDNPQRAQELSREYARLKELVAHGENYLKTLADLEQNRALLKSEPPESELAQMARRKLRGWKRTRKSWRSKSNSAFCRRTRRIRATPSLKSAPAPAARNPRCLPPIFTGCITATPKRAAGRSRPWIPARPTSAASRKSFFPVTGTDVFKRLKYESGVHRVQRVPATEAQGRIHTSTVHRRRAARSRRKWTSKSSRRNWKSPFAARPATAARA